MSAAEAVPSDENLYLLDAQMMGVARYGGLFILNAPRPAIVETGFSHTRDKTLQALEELDIDPPNVAYICPTHVHMDHAGGAAYLAEACPDARVLCHHRGAPHLADPARLVRSVRRAVGQNFQFYGDMKPIPDGRIVPVEGGEQFDLGDGYALEVIDAPGHAPHHACFYEHRTKGLFTGDAVGIYREETGFHMTTPPPSFHYERSLRTLDRLRERELEWLYFTHFGVQSRPYELMDAFEDRLTRWVDAIQSKLGELRSEQAIKERFVQEETAGLEELFDRHQLRQEVEMNVQGVLLYLQKHRS